MPTKPDELKEKKEKLKRTRALVEQYATDLADEDTPEEQSCERLEELGERVSRYLKGSGQIKLPADKRVELRRTTRLNGHHGTLGLNGA